MNIKYILFIGLIGITWAGCRKKKTGLNGTWSGETAGTYTDTAGIVWDVSWQDRIKFEESLPGEYTINTGCTVQSPIILKTNDSLICDMPLDNCKRNARIVSKLFRSEDKVKGKIYTNIRVEYQDNGFPVIRYYPFVGSFTWTRK